MGENYHEGRLEICFDQRWTAIVGDGWGIDDTMVACKQLGHTLTGILIGVYIYNFVYTMG